MGIVDGDHSVRGCYEDLDNLSRLKAGLMVVDDTIWLPHIGMGAKSFASKRGYQFLNLPVYNGVGFLVGRSCFESKIEQMAMPVLGIEWGETAVSLKRDSLKILPFILSRIRRKLARLLVWN